MQVEVEKTGAYTRHVSVTVPAAQVDAAWESVYKEIAKSARIPGFRPGKAPRGLIESRFRNELKSEVQNRLINETLYKAIEQHELSPVAVPHIDSGELKKKTDFAYTAQVDVQPEVPLQQYEGLEIESAEPEVSDAEVSQKLDEMRQQSVQLVPVLDRDTVQQGDVVQVDYEGTMGGIPFDGGTGENALVEVGGEEYLPGFSEGLIGAKVPGSAKVPITFPDSYPAEHLAGKDATFHVRLKELKKKELPELNDDFAQDMGEETLAALEEKVREEIKTSKERQARDEERKKLLQALVDANPFDVPPAMIEQQTDRLIQNATQQMQQILGRQMDFSREELQNLRADTRENAEFQVRSGLLLIEVAKAAGLEVSDEEVQAEIDKMAADAGEQATRVKATYSDPEQRDRLRYKMLDDKTLAYLREHAHIKEPAATSQAEATSGSETAAGDQAEPG